MTIIDILSSLFQGTLLIGLLAATIRMATPLLIASLGQIFTQLSGVMDLSVEGLMLMGAFFGFVGAYYTENILLGILLGMFAAATASLLMAFLCVSLRANQAIVGIMLVIMLGGLVTYLNKLIFGTAYIPPKSGSLSELHIPVLADLPVIGPILFQHNILVYVAFLLVPIVGVIMFKTSLGLKIRAVGEHPRAADSLGISVFKMKYLAILIGGLFAGLGGAFLTLGWTGGLYTDILTSGRGWLAVALVFFGKWNPYRVAAGALLFGFLTALQLRMQAMAGEQVAYQILLMMPYLLCILVLTMVSRKARAPGSFCAPYSRE